MSAEILAAMSVAMLGLGAVAILAVMVGLTWNVIREGWLSSAVRAPARRPIPQADDRTQPIRRAA